MRQFPRRKKRTTEKTAIKTRRQRKNESAECVCVPYEGVKHKLNVITRTTPSSSALLETSEAIIRESIIPALTSRREPLPIGREVLSLPLKSGGLGIDCPENHHDDYELSKKLSS